MSSPPGLKKATGEVDKAIRAYLYTTNQLKRLIKELKRRTKVVELVPKRVRSVSRPHAHDPPLGENDLTTEDTESTEVFYHQDARAQRNPGFQFPKIFLLFSAVALSTFESFCLRGRVDWLCDLRALVGELVSLRLGDFVANVPSGPSTPSTLLKLAIVLDSLLSGNSDLPRGGAAAGEIARARRNAVGNLLSPWKRYRKRVCCNAAYGRR